MCLLATPFDNILCNYLFGKVASFCGTMPQIIKLRNVTLLIDDCKTIITKNMSLAFKRAVIIDITK